jgi:hypothetical protein
VEILRSFSGLLSSDEAAKRRNLQDATRQIIDLVDQQVNPLGQWGLIPYFSFRSQSEQARLREEGFRLEPMGSFGRLIEHANFLSI